MKKIVLIGATGYVGSAILKEALGRGHEVKAIVRDPAKLAFCNPRLTVVQGDVMDTDSLARKLSGADTLVSAFNPGWTNPNLYKETLDGYGSILCSVRKSGIPRLLIVGGAGSLRVGPGRLVMDGPDIPKELLPGIQGLAKIYTDFLLPERYVDWVFLSPAANLIPGKRTGKFRLGKDDLIVDANGESRISVEDYAVAMVDELEKPSHHYERFTLGY